MNILANATMSLLPSKFSPESTRVECRGISNSHRPQKQGLVHESLPWKIQHYPLLFYFFVQLVWKRTLTSFYQKKKIKKRKSFTKNK